MSAVVVVGNPKPNSRTRTAAEFLAAELTGERPDLVIDLATLGGRLLEWDDAGIASLLEEIDRAHVVVFASPTYKATYTGLLKLLIDRVAVRNREGVAVPLMLGGSPAHSLTPEYTLRPVLAELGFVTTRALYVVDERYDDPTAYADWLEHGRRVVDALTSSGVTR